MGKPNPQLTFRLLLIEVLHRGKVFKNEEYGKKPPSPSTYRYRQVLTFTVLGLCQAAFFSVPSITKGRETRLWRS